MVMHRRFTQLAYEAPPIDHPSNSTPMAAAAVAAEIVQPVIWQAAQNLTEYVLPAAQQQQQQEQQQQGLLSRLYRPQGEELDLRAAISMATISALSNISSNINVQQGSPMWALGLVLMVLGTVSSGLGMLCLKRANSNTGVPWYRNGWFWGGITLFCVTAAGLDIIVFAITPLSLIAPFAGLTIVVSFFLASLGCCGVKETPSSVSLVAVVLITIGVTVCSIFGPKSDGQLYPSELQRTFDHHPWVYWLSVSGGFAFGVFVAITACYKVRTRSILRTWSGALSLAVTSAFFAALSQLQFKSLASAVFSTLSAMADGKEAPKLYESSNQLASQLLSVASAAVAQIGFLNFAISVAPVAYTVPAYQAGLLLLTLFLSGWLLDEFKTMSVGNEMMFWLGASIVGFGMLLNAWGLARAAEAKAKESLGDEALVDGGLAGSKSAWEDEYPGGDGDPESAQRARKAASMKFG